MGFFFFAKLLEGGVFTWGDWPEDRWMRIFWTPDHGQFRLSWLFLNVYAWMNQLGREWWTYHRVPHFQELRVDGKVVNLFLYPGHGHSTFPHCPLVPIVLSKHFFLLWQVFNERNMQLLWYANDAKFLDFFEYMFLVSYFNIVLITQSSSWLACNYLWMNYVSIYLSTSLA